jgi:hypothetical protein
VNVVRHAKIFALVPALFSLPFLAPAQVPDPGTGQYPRALPDTESGPGAQQDAEAEREKILKAADQLDLIESNSEATKLSVDNMKADLVKTQSDITELQAANAALKQQVADLQAALDKSEADRAKARGVLLDEVAAMITARNSGAPKASPHKHHEDNDATTDTPPPSTEVHAHDIEPTVGEAANSDPASTGGADKPSHEIADTTAPSLAPPPEDSPPPKPQKGYYHVVESGETLTMICAAYRDQGVAVSISQVRKANGLTRNSVLKVGQRLFIPKPGT